MRYQRRRVCELFWFRFGLDAHRRRTGHVVGGRR